MKVLSKPILKVKIEHEFFEGGIWKNIAVQASPESSFKMSNERIHLYAQADGFVLVKDFPLYPSGFQKGPVEGQACLLRLLLQPADPLAHIYTAFPATAKRWERFYFSNKDAAGRAREKQLSTGDWAGLEDLLHIRPKQFSFPTALPEGEPVRVLSGERVVYSTWVNPNGKAIINLAREEEGNFALQFGAGKQRFFTSSEMDRSSFAYLDLHLEPGLMAHDNEPVPEFRLAFPARSIYWRYNILIGDRPLDTVRVIDPDGAIQFEELPPGDEGPPGRRVFATKTKIKLRELQPYAFKLVNGSNESVLSERLPFPDINFLKIDPARQGEFFAESFLSLP